jgi:hypothetical protein
VGPDPPSAAFGVNPAGGYATVTEDVKADLNGPPQVKITAKASLANTVAGSFRAGTNRLIPYPETSTYVRPTIPLTFPVFSFGGKILPEPKTTVLINPRVDSAAAEGDRCVYG